jgi:predicted regulator of Ras-like GTPase activity (Roadblock/LC7/MglB family)
MIDTIELDDRIAKCEKILANDSNSQIFAALADAYRKKGEIDKACEICEEGLKIHPNYVSARVVMAKIHVTEGDYIAAKEQLDLAIKSAGRSRAIDILEAEILIRLEKIPEAKVILKRLSSTDPDDEVVTSLMSMVGEETYPSRKRADLSKTNAAEKKYTLSSVVGILKVMPRVMGVVAVSENGLVLEGRFDGFVSKEEVGALSKNIYDQASNGAGKVGLGVTREILIETQISKLWIFERGNFLLVVFTRDDVSMGSLKLKIDDLLSKSEITIGRDG